MSDPIIYRIVPEKLLLDIRAALDIGYESTCEVLADHDTHLGRTTRGNRLRAELLEVDKLQILEAIASIDAKVPMSDSRDTNPC